MKFGSGACTFLSASVLVLGFSLLGCGPGGPPTVPVSGTITKGGQPLANITINLIDSANPDNTATGTSDASGKFELVYGTIGKKGAVAGKYKVVLTGGGSAPVTTGADGKATGYGGGGPGAGGSSAPKLDLPYDSKWSSAETSPMDVEVKSGMGPVEVKVE